MTIQQRTDYVDEKLRSIMCLNTVSKDPAGGLHTGPPQFFGSGNLSFENILTGQVGQCPFRFEIKAEDIFQAFEKFEPEYDKARAQAESEFLKKLAEEEGRSIARDLLRSVFDRNPNRGAPN